MFKDNCRRQLLTRPGVLSLLMLMTALAGVSDAAALNDPTRPPNRSLSTTSAGITASPASRLELTSILVAPERRVAVINGRAVQVGERIGAYRVIAIQFDAVRVKNDNRMISLTLKHGDVKKSVVLPAKGE